MARVIMSHENYSEFCDTKYFEPFVIYGIKYEGKSSYKICT